MILRKLKWTLIAQLVYLTIVIEAQNARSYDTNDWIPITPTSSNEQTDVGERRATGRVLNLDAPVQKFFPEDDYHHRKKRPQVQQFLRESSLPKSGGNRHHKQKIPNRPYKYESVSALNHQPKYHQQGQPPLQYFTNQEVKLPTVEQPPPLQQPQFIAQTLQLQQQPQQQFVVPPPAPQQLYRQQQQQHLNQQEVPAPAAPNLYEQYISNNTNLHESLNPTSINQELLNAIKIEQTTSKSQQQKKQDDETVQLLYVPLENLKPNQPISQGSQTIYRQAEAPRQHDKILNFVPNNNKQQQQHRLENIEQDFIQQALQAHKLQQQILLGQPIVYQTTTSSTTTTTTPKPKKQRKPHQPPLAVYMGGDDSADVDDVLNVLKDAKTIAVQDTVQQDSPKIFIGPSTIDAPDGYTKFPLPYLNSLSGNRIERKIEQLPFFVAPLSYKTPPGYSKIPLPSPHVGSVVISNKEELHEKHALSRQPSTDHNQNHYQFSNKPYRQATLPPTVKTTTENLVSQQYNFDQPGYVPANSFDQLIKNQYTQQQYELPQAAQLNQFSQQTAGHGLQDEVKPRPQSAQPVQFNEPSYSGYNEQTFNTAKQTESPAQLEAQFSQPAYISQEVSEVPAAPPQLVQENQFKYSSQENVRRRPQTPQVQQFNEPLQSSQAEEEIKQHPQPVELVQYEQPTYNTRKRVPQKPRPAQFVDFSDYSSQKEVTQKPQTVKFVDDRPTLPPNPPQPVQYQDNYNVEKALKQTPQFPELVQYNVQPSYEQQEDIKENPAINITPKSVAQKQSDATTGEKFTQTYLGDSGYKPTPQFLNPLELAIDQYELHQINSQLEPNQPAVEQQQEYAEGYNTKPQLSSSTTPAPVALTENYEEFTTTPKPSRNKPQRRRKPTRTSANQQPAKPTESTFDNSKYTVLEEFSIKPQSSTPKYLQEYETRTTTPKYAEYAEIKTKVETIPSKVYEIISTTPKYELPANVENTPANVYKLPQTPAPNAEYVEEKPLNLHTLNQQLMDQQILKSHFNIEQKPTFVGQTPQNVYNIRPQQTAEQKPTFVGQTPQDVYIRPQQTADEIVNIQPLVQNRGHDYNENPTGLNVPIFETHQQNDQLPPRHEIKDILPGISSLEDQSVRPLLVPALLAPTTPRQQLEEHEISTTDFTPKISSTETPYIETTTTPRPKPKGRGRGGNNRYYTPPTVAPTRRAPIRRRPLAPRTTSTTTERIRTTTDYTPPDYLEQNTRRLATTNNRQRFRTRGRPIQNTERIQTTTTTENEIKSFSPPILQGGFQALAAPEPNSYMQFEHTVDEQKIITIKPDVQDTYSLSESSEKPLDSSQSYETSTSQKPVVDIQITHPVTEVKEAVLLVDIPERPRLNVQSGGVLYNNKNNDGTTTTRSSVRVRGRTRGRSRFGSSTTTTYRPSTTRLTTTERQVKIEEPQEFFGFIRKPTFSKPQPVDDYRPAIKATTEQPVQVYSSTYQSSPAPSIITYEDVDKSDDYSTERIVAPAVHFVGEIRPKYQTTVQYDDITVQPIEPETPPPKVRSRGRIRIPSRNTQDNGIYHQQNHRSSSYNDVSGPGINEQATRRSNSVVRTRGRSHFKIPNSLKDQIREDSDENLNYPASFFQNKETSSSTTSTTTVSPGDFQISFGPQYDEDDIEDDDQSPHPSLYRPRIVAKPDSSAWTPSSRNHLTRNGKTTTTTEGLVALPFVGSSTAPAYVETSNKMEKLSTDDKVTKKNSRRRGVWKLVRQRPVDQFETAESQNYQSVINNFEAIEKVNRNKYSLNQSPNVPNADDTIATDFGFGNEEQVADEIPTTLASPTTEEEGLLDTLYEMFGISAEKSETIAPPTTLSPDFTDGFTDLPTTEIPKDSVELNETSSTIPVDTTTTTARLDITTTLPVSSGLDYAETETENETETETTTTDANEDLAAVTQNPFEVEPWEMRAVKTSTSTEISHATEICYKGRCVKSKERKIRS